MLSYTKCFNLFTEIHISIKGFPYMHISGYCYRLIKIYLTNRFRRFTVNEYTSSRRHISAGAFQGNILALLLLLIYLHNGLKTSIKFLAGKISLFTIIKEKTWRAKLITISVTFFYSQNGLLTGKA